MKNFKVAPENRLRLSFVLQSELLKYFGERVSAILETCSFPLHSIQYTVLGSMVSFQVLFSKKSLYMSIFRLNFEIC